MEVRVYRAGISWALGSLGLRPESSPVTSPVPKPIVT